MRLLLLLALVGCTTEFDEPVVAIDSDSPTAEPDSPYLHRDASCTDVAPPLDLFEPASSDLDDTIASDVAPLRVHVRDHDPDFAQGILEAAEEAWQANLDWGALAPPADDESGPDELLDIYLVEAHDSWASVRPLERREGGGCASQMAVRQIPEFDLSSHRAVVHHEMRHVFQLAAHCEAHPWMEGDATFAAIASAPEGNIGADLLISSFQANPRRIGRTRALSESGR